jgi:hypothetical protein
MSDSRLDKHRRGLLKNIKRIGRHFRDFHIIWIILAVVLVTPLLYQLIGGEITPWPFCLAIILFFGYLIWKPLGAVHGLMGTSGSIRILFLNFVLISFIFAGVYYYGFFKDAGITYDVNQPHIDYKMFAANLDKSDSTKTIIMRDTVYIERQTDNSCISEAVVHFSADEIKYQRISFGYVLRNTILTTLMQDPGDLFTLASTYNQGIESNDTSFDKWKCNLFQWTLIVQILISWIFFGVFIALLYDKFRHES